MKQDCRNDCVDRPRFPRLVDNRAGLSHITYRLGSYADIREALLRNLDKTPGLSQWTHRGADDPGIALLEGASILGDILTFYQELYANEAYLRTARWRESIADLVRLLGYRLSPGLGGRATFAFEIEGDQPVTIPAGFPVKPEVEGLDKPADFETTGQTIAYPWLSKFNLYRPLATPNITASTSEFYIQTPDQLTAAVTLKPGDRLMIGDLTSYLNKPSQLNDPEIVIVDSIRELHGITLFKIKGSLKRSGVSTQVAAYKLGRNFHHFGFNGPSKVVKPPAQSTTTSSTDAATKVTTTTTNIPAPVEYRVTFSRDWFFDETTVNSPYNDYEGPNAIRIVQPTLSTHDYPLDAEVKDLANGALLIAQTSLRKDTSSPHKEFAFLRTITGTRSTSVTWGLVTGPSTILTLNDVTRDPADGTYFIGDIRLIQFHEVLSPLLSLRAAMEPAALSINDTLNIYGDAAQAQTLAGRDLILVKTGSEPIIVHANAVEAASATDGTHPLLHKVTIDRNDLNYADFSHMPPYTVTCFGNVVQATQGKTETQAPLGNGDNRLVFQTFKVPKAPLTYLISSSDTPPEVPELQIYVNDRLWKRVSSFFDRQPDEEIYIVREDGDNHTWVQFGDGQTGARLPSGVKNVVARYRTGTGAFGALKPNTKVQAGGKLERLDKIQLPDVVAGGSQPEDGESARDAAPGKVQSLNRLVSLGDFESETLAISGVTKAAAAWQLMDNVPEVAVTVLMATGRSGEIADVRETLAGYNHGRGPSRFPIGVLEGQLQYVVIDATFGYDSTYRDEDIRKAIQKALGVNSGKPNIADDQSGLFSLRQRAFGHREYATSIAGTIQQVAGVTWAYVTRFESLGTIADPTVVTPPVTPIVIQPIVACDSQNVLSLYAGHLQLTGVAETVPEVKR